MAGERKCEKGREWEEAMVWCGMDMICSGGTGGSLLEGEGVSLLEGEEDVSLLEGEVSV